jgi:hypothetical protein
MYLVAADLCSHHEPVYRPASSIQLVSCEERVASRTADFDLCISTAISAVHELGAESTVALIQGYQLPHENINSRWIKYAKALLAASPELSDTLFSGPDKFQALLVSLDCSKEASRFRQDILDHLHDNNGFFFEYAGGELKFGNWAMQLRGFEIVSSSASRHCLKLALTHGQQRVADKLGFDRAAISALSDDDWTAICSFLYERRDKSLAKLRRHMRRQLMQRTSVHSPAR